MAKLLKQLHQPSINPDEITLIFPTGKGDKPYPWRREGDITIDPDDTTHPLWDLYDERILDPVPSETVANIAELGVKQAVLLTERDGKIFKVDGLGRIKARRLANAKLEAEGLPPGNVPYATTADKDASVLAALRVTLNAHRKDDSMLAKARLAEKLVDRFAWTPAQAANYFNVSVTAIKSWLAMLTNCAPEVIKAVEKNKIAATTALAYSKLPTEEQATRLEEDLAAIDGKTQVRSDKPKTLSGTQAAKPRTEPTQEQIAERRFHKAVDLLNEMEPSERLRVFALFDAETGEEAPLVTPEQQAEMEAASQFSLLLPEADAQDLSIEYDDQVIDEPEKPTVKRRKRASK